MDDNVSPEALLTGHRKLRGPIQVVPFQPEGELSEVLAWCEKKNCAVGRNVDTPPFERERVRGTSAANGPPRTSTR